MTGNWAAKRAATLRRTWWAACVSPSQCWYRMSGTRAPWGDYGRILLSGMTAHQERTPEGLLRLERTGPFVPPVSMPGLGDLLVTDAFRARLEESPLAGLGFRPVEKTRIVRLEWEHWDQDDFEPEEYPDSGEPEDYILSRPHDPELAARIGACVGGRAIRARPGRRG